MKINFPGACFATIGLALFLPCHAGKIHNAVTKRDLAALARVLKKEPQQINRRSYPDFRTPLHMAVAVVDPAMVKVLLDAGTDPSLSGPDSLSASQMTIRLWETPLQRAVMRMGEDRPFCIGNVENPDWQLPNFTLQKWKKSHLKAVTPVSDVDKKARLDVIALLLRQKPTLDKGFAQGLPPLHAAAGLGDAEVVRLLIDFGADVNGKSARSWLTPLHLAAMSPGAPELIDLLISAGARVESTDRMGRTPLMIAAFSGSLPAVKKLVAHRAGLDPEDIGRKTAIGYAAVAGHDDVVTFLYQNGGPDLIRLAQKNVLFANAASGGNRQLAELLLAGGVDVDIRDETGATPLLNAGRDHPNLARFLMGKEANKTAKSKDGISLFSVACFGENTSIARELLADQVVSSNDPNLLTDAAIAGCVDLVKVLLDQAADMNAKNRDGRTPLECAILGFGLARDQPVLRVAASEDDFAEVVELLLNHGAKVNPPVESHLPLVHLAAMECAARVMKALLKAGGKLNSTTGVDDKTPTQFAAAFGRAETVRVLLDAGAYPKQLDDLGNTLLHLAANEGNAEVVKLLIGEKLPVNARNQAEGGTPLHGAAFSNSLECLRLLLAAGADPNATDSDDRTALTLAIDIKDLPKPTESKDDQRFYQRVTDLLSRLRIIHELLEAGASTTVVPAEYKSLTEYVRDRGCPEIIELLQHPPQAKKRPSKP